MERDPDGLDLKQLEDDREALEEKLNLYQGRKILLPWEKKAKEAVEQEIGRLNWAIVSASEIVAANKWQQPIYENAKKNDTPMDSADKLKRVDELMKARKLKMKMAKLKR